MKFLIKNLPLIFLLLAVIVVVGMTNVAWGTDWNECDHPRFLEKGCGYEGEDGADGKDGLDGRDGKDGTNGVDGRDGVDGKNGRDGEVPTEWINNVYNLFDESRDYLAATVAMQVYLPQEQTSRLTFSGSRVGNTTGLGVGYAYMMDNSRNTALTLAVGRAGGETAVSGSIGFEFGGQRKMVIEIAEIVQPEPVNIQPIIEQQQVIEVEHEEDIEVMQMAQASLEDRIEALEKKPAPRPRVVQAPAEKVEKVERYTYEQRQAVFYALGIEEDE